MAIDPAQLELLIRQPSESLQVELKTWLNPTVVEDAAKLVKAMFALRNRNGGFLIIGFDNSTLQPDAYPFSESIANLYHADEIQGLLSRYANLPFEVEIAFGERDGQSHPVISVPESVRVPLVVKRDLAGNGGRKLLREGDLYFRTLRSNGTPSSARISPGDYADLLDICFENREADIGRFMRRQLAGLDLPNLGSLLAGVAAVPIEDFRTRAFDALERGEEQFLAAVLSRQLSDQCARVSHALTMQVAMVLEPAKPQSLPTQEFMSRVAGGNPQYSGWPVWLDTRFQNDRNERAYVHEGAWQALLADLDSAWFPMFEFLRYDPRGEFYLRRTMQDDLTDKVQAGTALDAVLMIYRVTEVLATGTSIARATGWADDDVAGFAFRWTHLNNRRLTPWVNAFRSVGARGQSTTPSADSFVEVPLRTPHLAMAPYVKAAIDPLFTVFDGFAPSLTVVEGCVQKVIERKMDS